MVSVDWLVPFSDPPASTIFILCLCMAVSFTVSLVNKFFRKTGEFDALKREFDACKAFVDKAKRSGDKKLLAKARKREVVMLKLQGKMFRQQMKTTAVLFVPFLLIWMFLTGRILFWQLFETPFTHGRIVAFLPWFDHDYELDYFMWYLLCSFLFSTLFSRVFGISMGATQ